MTYTELAIIYLAQSGLGEATALVHFEYRDGKTWADVTQQLIWAEANIRMAGSKVKNPERLIAWHLRRVLARIGDKK